MPGALFIASPVAPPAGGAGIQMQAITVDFVFWPSVCCETMDSPVCNDFDWCRPYRLEDEVPELINNVDVHRDPLIFLRFANRFRSSVPAPFPPQSSHP